MKKAKKQIGPSYGNITFAIGYNKTLPEFEKEFSDMEIFKNMPEVERKIELEKAHKIATDGNTTKAVGTSQTGK